MPAARRCGNPGKGPAPTRAAAALLVGAVAGCGLSSEPAPILSRVMPAAGYDDAPLALAILGDSFRPTYRIDARTGGAAVDTGGFQARLVPNAASGSPVPLDGVLWQSLGLLAGQLPAGTPSGWYDLVVTDPRGRASTLMRAFQSLGPDTSAPLVRIISPTAGTTFAVGASVPIVATADDGLGTVTAFTAVMSSGSGAQQTYNCAVTGEPMVSCAFTLPAPGTASTPDDLTIHVTATDGAGQVGDARAQFALVRAPSFDSLSPPSGSTRGKTLVHIEGAGFLQPGAQIVAQVLFDGLPAAVQSQGANSLDVVTPEHTLAGPVSVSVTIAGVTVRKEAGFTYVSPPLVRQILPASGPAAGGFPVTVIGDNFTLGSTQIYFGMAPLRCPKYGNSNRIDGIAPPGQGIQAVIADDTVSGSIPNGTIPFRYVQDGGIGPADAGSSPDASVGLIPDDGTADASCPGAP